jgi:hypothetical protein
MTKHTAAAYICNYTARLQVFTLFNLLIRHKARPASANPLNSAFYLWVNPNPADLRLSYSVHLILQLLLVHFLADIYSFFTYLYLGIFYPQDFL